MLEVGEYMDFTISEEQQMLKKNIGEFAQEELVPMVREIDEKGGFSWEVWKKLTSMGLPGLSCPEEYGGEGITSLLTQTMVAEELARYDFSSAANIVSCWSTMDVLIALGNEEQKARYLEPICNGKMVAAFALTEPNAGSDVGAMRTNARKEEGYYVINGDKCFVTQAGEAEIIIVMVRTSNEGRYKGISAILVEKDTPGLILGQKEDKLGYRGSTTNSLSFDECRVPFSNLLWKEGDGLSRVMQMLTSGRVLTAAQALGQAQAALDASLKYARERTQFGKPIGSFQLIQGMLADMAIQIESARLLVYYAAWLHDNDRHFNKYASMAKTLASDVAMKAAVDAVQIYGGYGFMRDYPVESIMRNVKITQIFEGTNQIQRIIIARELLGEIAR